MGKKGTKRKTRWRTLPLGEEDAGSGNEEELLDEDRSTTSSAAGQIANVKIHPPILGTAEKLYRPQRRFPYDRFRSKEPLVKLESKTFDEEEYTKITTPRQDVLFKKGYFGRKRESSAEEVPHSFVDAEGDEPVMDQYIITNGFLDERGHYYVNGSSYEVYDPYSNTVTLVVGPPPYANGVNQPVLAAVSCQPVPLTPVEWYPPGSDWPSHGSAWTPSYPQGDSASDGDVGSAFNNHQPVPATYHQSGYAVADNLYNGSDGVTSKDKGEPNAEETDGKESDPEKLTGEKERSETRQTSGGNDELREEGKAQLGEAKPEEEMSAEIREKSVADAASEAVPNRGFESETGESTSIRWVEKQSHSTQTNSSGSEVVPAILISTRVKESHSTQTVPEEAFSMTEVKTTEEKPVKITDDVKIERSPEATSGGKFSPRREEEGKKSFQRRMNEGSKQKADFKAPCNNEIASSKTSYAKKLLNSLEKSTVLNKCGELVKKSHAVSSHGESLQISPGNGGEWHTCTTVGDQGGKRQSNNNKCATSEGKKTCAWNGSVRNGYEKHRYSKCGVKSPNKMNENFKEKKTNNLRSGRKASENTRQEEQTSLNTETTTAESRSQSEKSSTVSELSSPTELSSGQNTPPEKIIVRKMEEKIANDLNKSFEEKLKQNLTRAKADEEADEEEEEEEDEGEERRTKSKPKKKKKSKSKEEGMARSKRAKRKKRGTEEKGEKGESEDSPEENPFFRLCGEPQDFLSQAWESMTKERGGEEFVPDLHSLLTSAGNDQILETLGIVEKWNVPKLPLASDLLLFPGFGHERPKLKFEDFFASATLKEFQNEVFTKRNITNMRSTKPEEFFASVIENPGKERNRSERKEGGKVGRKGVRTSEESVQRKAKANGKASRKAEEEGGGKREEGKLGIVDAVNTWLREQGEEKKLLSGESPSVPSETDKEKEKNECCNPVRASSAEEGERESSPASNAGAEEGRTRVANASKDDGYLGTETNEKKEEKLSARRLYRSSSWDAKLSEAQLKKHFQYLMEASSWDRRKLNDARLRRHFQFIAESANFFCRDFIGDVRNGYEIATEELCDPRQSVSKYYTLSPATLDSPEKTIECEGDAFDALDALDALDAFDYDTLERSAAAPDKPSVTDSGVHSDSEASEEAHHVSSADSAVAAVLPKRELCCKMQ